MKNQILTILISLFSVSAVATNTPVPPSKTPNTTAHSESAAESNAAALAASQSHSAVKSNTTVDTSSNAESGSTNLIDASTVYERQVGTLIMGTVIPIDCGFGGQAGGANTNGSGFLGASWTTETCYALKVANGFAAVGEYEYACELWIGITAKFLRKRRGITNVDCAVVGARLRAGHEHPVPALPTSVSAPPHSAGPDYVTREELQTMVDRAFKKAVSK
jgi:hypothetical protein